MSMNTNKIALSFDVEDWFTVRNMREHISEDSWEQQEWRVHIGLDFILDSLLEKNVKATFFILGWIAERAPELVLKIMNQGHEIASHGYSHTPIDLLTPEAFEADLLKSIQVLQAITNKKIRGFRAPSFSITKETSWAIDILKKCGLEYDSSIFKISHPDYGVGNFPGQVTNLQGLVEVPMKKGKFFGVDLPVCGGGYFRMIPYGIIKSSLSQTLQKEPVVMYFHPWEFDQDQPKIDLPALKKFRHYVGLKQNRQKFQKLLRDFEFMTIEQMIDENKKPMATYDFTSIALISQNLQ
ncbi:MAG: polysaccharide deacetylase family protein [Bdellovibrio sp. CG12_big_fil_rev_8_21_14_0_65_39_13]|nr:MAG: polysaccharide deacetylase family protein [Bdellovibrio sp. CG22_combo_CG10-13_8_21_14_all_39_27]PIQ58610.1 MAG: polysaccharide deacetylase family protein [Bdellovibrio sp. CG12_big_fil_rev_8_21_14_0_65_39_13]PIR33818.1 MAG: polysaccharide deacetylase family protein [Bdellovibrio sp. CG11_big_fil_rev_8_21_14_0_20_39_38]